MAIYFFRPVLAFDEQKFRFGLFHFLSLLSNDEVRALQMLLACFPFGDAPLHFQTLSQKCLHLHHVLFAQLAGLARFVVHPVPYDMGVKVRLPCSDVLGSAVMSFVTVNEYL